MVAKGDQSALKTSCDLAAELMMRGLELPFEMLQDKSFLLETDKERPLIDRLQLLKSDIQDFVRELEKPTRKN